MTTEIPDLPEVPESVFIEDPSQIAALESPFRMRILKLADKPMSTREMAESLHVPVTRLYHHVNMLTDAGFLEIVHTRKSGARLEKLYRIAGKSITPAPDLLERVDDPEAVARSAASIVVGPLRVEAEAAILRRFEGDGTKVVLGRTVAMLTPAEAEEVADVIETLVDEKFADRDDTDDPAAVEYTFTYALLTSQLT
ncbi:MAG: winged helix-turn-helix transcriptional regulator [Acidimicrobiia bacterium]|nr:winged helix-turn-helix transcriptional regulator [Acidimicrobiia bacterium]